MATASPKTDIEARLKIVSGMSSQQLRLQFGEMSADEVRTVRAVLKWIRGTPEKRSAPTKPVEAGPLRCAHGKLKREACNECNRPHIDDR